MKIVHLINKTNSGVSRAYDLIVYLHSRMVDLIIQKTKKNDMDNLMAKEKMM